VIVILADLCKIWTTVVDSHANTGHVTKTVILDTQNGGRLPGIWDKAPTDVEF